MADKKYQVFISSTHDDLLDERRELLNVLLANDCIPIGMENFLSSTNDVFDVIKEHIDLSDFFILILGQRYGSINRATGISITEMEYDYAKAQNIPILAFPIDASVKLPVEKTETKRNNQRLLEKFRTKALDGKSSITWTSTKDLLYKVSASISNAKMNTYRPGWVRVTTSITDDEFQNLLTKNSHLELKLTELTEIIIKNETKIKEILLEKNTLLDEKQNLITEITKLTLFKQKLESEFTAISDEKCDMIKEKTDLGLKMEIMNDSQEKLKSEVEMKHNEILRLASEKNVLEGQISELENNLLQVAEKYENQLSNYSEILISEKKKNQEVLQRRVDEYEKKLLQMQMYLNSIISEKAAATMPTKYYQNEKQFMSLWELKYGNNEIEIDHEKVSIYKIFNIIATCNPESITVPMAVTALRRSDVSQSKLASSITYDFCSALIKKFESIGMLHLTRDVKSKTFVYELSKLGKTLVYE